MMIVNYREKMREYLKEPNEICNHYGKWGILNKEQRDLITRLLNEMDGADNYIKKIQQENERLKDKINMAIEYYEANQQECVIGRNKDDKLIKEYYLPAQCSKKMLDILKEN